MRKIIPIALTIFAILICLGVYVFTGSKSSTTIPSTEQVYMHIKELGIKVKLSDGIKDAIYYFDKDFNAQYPDPKMVTISTQSLSDKSNGACKPSLGNGQLGTIQVTTNHKDGFGNEWVVNGENVVKVADKYVILHTPQAGCSSEQSVFDLAAKQRQEFTEAFKTVQPE